LIQFALLSLFTLTLSAMQTVGKNAIRKMVIMIFFNILSP
jgi:hypothetical protein